jgi:hypothetical protein
VLLRVQGVNLPMPTAVSATTLFAQDPSVTVQLHNGDGKCWTSAFTSNTANKLLQYKAKVK